MKLTQNQLNKIKDAVSILSQLIKEQETISNKWKSMAYYEKVIEDLNNLDKL